MDVDMQNIKNLKNTYTLLLKNLVFSCPALNFNNIQDTWFIFWSLGISVGLGKGWYEIDRELLSFANWCSSNSDLRLFFSFFVYVEVWECFVCFRHGWQLQVSKVLHVIPIKGPYGKTSATLLCWSRGRRWWARAGNSSS